MSYQISPNPHKLEPSAIKCVFIGYFPTQKGYKCFFPTSQKFFVSYDVTLVKYEFYRSTTPLQMEENHWDPTMLMPITLPISSPPPNDNPIQTAAADHS